MSSPAFGKRRLVPWNSSSVNDFAVPRDAASFSISAATAIGGSATAVVLAMIWHAAVNSAQRIDAISKVPQAGSITETSSAPIGAARLKKT